MIKSVLTFIFFGISNLFISPNDSDAAKPLAVLYPHSEIEILQHRNKASINISEGDKLVFSIDDVKLGSIYFQVPEYRRFFRYTNGSMKNVDLIIVKNNEISIPEAGEINGFKIADGLWRVDIVLREKEKTYTVSHRFYQHEDITTAHN